MPTDLLHDILPHIKNAVFPQRIEISDWKMKEGNIPEAQSVAFNDKSWTSVRIPLEWGKYDKTYWFRQTVKVPPEFAGRAVAFISDLDDALLFVNGEPYAGLDKNHQAVMLTEKARAHQEFVLAIQAYSGRKNQHNHFSKTYLATFNKTAQSLATTLNALNELETELEEGSEDAKNIGGAILQSLKFLKWFDPNGEAYPAQIERAHDFLIKKMESDLKSALPGTIHLLPTTHLDFDWLWDRNETVRKIARTVASALRILETHPTARFSFSQPAQYALLQKHYPNLFKQVRQRIVENRWEVLGASWVEHDSQIISGESIVRQLLQGTLYSKNELGVESTVAWLPDSFGFNGNLPQIFQKSGIRSFYTAKLRWNETTNFPHTTFWWEGVDGSRILSHVSPLNFGADVSPKELHITGGDFSPELPLNASLHVFGYGDGGGGVSTEQLGRAEALKNVAGVSPLQITNAKEFFATVEPFGKNLPVWKGELYLEKHRGTFTTLAWVKKAIRDLEQLLYQAEVSTAMGSVLAKPKRYPAETLTSAWRSLLTNQFHDIIDGTSIQAAYPAIRQELEATTAQVGELIQNSQKHFLKQHKASDDGVQCSVFNPASHTRSEYVEITFKSAGKFFTAADSNGSEVLCQIVGREKKSVTVLCYLPSIPPFAFVNFTVTAQENAPDTADEENWKFAAHGLETPVYRLRFDNKGTLSSVYDKKIRKELLVKGKRGNVLQCYRDTPREWEAWDIDGDFDRHRADILALKSFRIVEKGPLRASVKLEYRSTNGSTIVQHICLYHAVQRIDFQTQVQWKEQQTLLKVIFPVNVKANAATYEIPFGAIQRNSKHKTPEEKAKFEVPALHWADISDQKFGVSILNDSKHGYDAKENTLRLTLLRSARAVHPLDPKSQTETQVPDQGEHRFTYSLYSHAGDWKKGQTVLAARALNVPLQVNTGASGIKMPPFVKTSKPNVVISAIKQAETGDALVLRAYESSGEQTDCTFTFATTVKSAEETDLMEGNGKDVKTKKETLSARFKPFEVKTFKLTLKPLKLK